MLSLDFQKKLYNCRRTFTGFERRHRKRISNDFFACHLCYAPLANIGKASAFRAQSEGTLREREGRVVVLVVLGWGGGGVSYSGSKKHGLLYFYYSMVREGGAMDSACCCRFSRQTREQAKRRPQQGRKTSSNHCEQNTLFCQCFPAFPHTVKKSDEIPTYAAEKTSWVSDFSRKFRYLQHNLRHRQRFHPAFLQCAVRPQQTLMHIKTRKE